MSIPVQCPGCGHNFAVPDSYAGKRGKCPRCATIFRAEEPETFPVEDELDEFPLVQPLDETTAKPAAKRPAASDSDPGVDEIKVVAGRRAAAATSRGKRIAPVTIQPPAQPAPAVATKAPAVAAKSPESKSAAAPVPKPGAARAGDKAKSPVAVAPAKKPDSGEAAAVSKSGAVATASAAKVSTAPRDLTDSGRSPVVRHRKKAATSTVIMAAGGGVVVLVCAVILGFMFMGGSTEDPAQNSETLGQTAGADPATSGANDAAAPANGDANSSHDTNNPASAADAARNVYKKALVRIDAKHGAQTRIGTGFLVDDRGWIVTSKHFIDDADTVSAVFDDNTSIPCTAVVAENADYGLTVLQLQTKPSSAKAFAVTKATRPQSREPLLACGHPLNFTAMFQKGTVEKVVATEDLPAAARSMARELNIDDGANWIQHTLAATGELVGGPILNEQGEVWGVNLNVSAGQHGYAMHAMHLLEVLDAPFSEPHALRVDTPLAQNDPPAPHNPDEDPAVPGIDDHASNMPPDDDERDPWIDEMPGPANPQPQNPAPNPPAQHVGDARIDALERVMAQCAAFEFHPKSAQDYKKLQDVAALITEMAMSADAEGTDEQTKEELQASLDKALDALADLRWNEDRMKAVCEFAKQACEQGPGQPIFVFGKAKTVSGQVTLNGNIPVIFFEYFGQEGGLLVQVTQSGGQFSLEQKCLIMGRDVGRVPMNLPGGEQFQAVAVIGKYVIGE